MGFDGKVALVTGAAGSIGEGIARRLCEQGAKVFITDLDQARLDEIGDELSAAGAGQCTGLAADVTVADQVARAVAACVSAHGERIDVLVNVAGTIGAGAKVEEMTEENWEWVFAVNCKGTFLFVKEAVPHMKGGGGRIVNFSSKSGKTGSALMSAYSAAKAAVIGFTQALAHELAGEKINVNCVCPGIVAETGICERLLADYVRTMGLPADEIVRKFTAKVPMGRLASIEDVVAVTLFLCSSGADYMTGQAVNITGGREMH